jgi:hypothetical protein
MKIIYIKRTTTFTTLEKRYSVSMGELTTRVTYIKKYFLGLPLQTIHKYRQTYYGEVKEGNESMLFV